MKGSTKIYTGKNRRKNKNYLTKAPGNYLSVISLEQMDKLLSSIYWNNSESQKLVIYENNRATIDKLRTLYKPIILARNQLAKEDGYPNYVEMQKAHYGIPEKSYQIFLTKSDQVIAFLNKQLPQAKGTNPWSIYNSRCFLCQITDLNYQIPEDIYAFMVKHYPQLKKVLPKTELGFTDEQSRTSYNPGKDAFSIRLHKHAGVAHKATDLIHELCHVVVYLEYLKEGQDPKVESPLTREIKAVQLESHILPLFSQKIWQANCGVILGNFWRALFEIESYTNPDQDLDHLYAQTFNRCFLASKQRSNPFYLINRFIVALPLTGLVGSVADVCSGTNSVVIL